MAGVLANQIMAKVEEFISSNSDDLTLNGHYSKGMIQFGSVPTKNLEPITDTNWYESGITLEGFSGKQYLLRTKGQNFSIPERLFLSHFSKQGTLKLEDRFSCNGTMPFFINFEGLDQ